MFYNDILRCNMAIMFLCFIILFYYIVLCYNIILSLINKPALKFKFYSDYYVVKAGGRANHIVNLIVNPIVNLIVNPIVNLIVNPIVNPIVNKSKCSIECTSPPALTT